MGEELNIVGIYVNVGGELHQIHQSTEIKLNIKTEKDMKKSDLKSGMIVELRNGDRAICMTGCDTKRYGKDTTCFINEKGFIGANSLNDDLTNKELSKYDIMKIYYDGHITNDVFKMTNSELLWIRPEPIQLTISEIEKKLNIEKGTLKIVGE